jgi:DNA-binding transcriptional LysR family regulator
MDLRHARTFVTVAEVGTVTRAAVRLHVAQPALSRQIADLEQEFGLRLFDRVGRRLMLTGEGAQLLADCRHLLSAATSLRERAQALRGGDTGVLRVAASPQFIEGVFANFLHRYRERCPNVRVELIESIAWTDTLGMLERGDIHLGQNLLRAVAAGDKRFASRTLGVVDLLAASREPLKAARGDAIEIARLASDPLLLLDTSFVSRRTLDATCRLAGLEPNVFFESRTPHTLLAMAERGHGVAIVPSAVQISRYALHVSAVTHRGKPVRERLAVFWDARRTLPRYAIEFCALLAAHVGDALPISRPGATARTSQRRRARWKGTAP